MNRIYLVLILGFSLFFGCKQKTAIVEDEPPQIEEKTPEVVRSASQEMYHQLEMTNEQRAAFIAIKEKYQKINRSAIRSAQANPEGMKEKMEAIKRQHETELQGLFSPEQYVKYLEWENNKE